MKNKTDREYEKELSAMPPEAQAQVRAIMGTPVGAAVALHREITANREAVSALVEEVRANTAKTMQAVADLTAKIGVHDYQLGCLERSHGELENRVEKIAEQVRGLSARMGAA